MKHPCPLHLYSVPHENPQHLSLALILCSRKNGKILLTSECCYCDDVYELSDFTKPRIEDRPVLYCHPLSIYLDISIYLPVSDVAGERQTPPRLLTATATALCGERGDGVNSWVAATPSPATLGIVHCILHYILHRSNRMY